MNGRYWLGDGGLPGPGRVSRRGEKVAGFSSGSV